MRDSQPLSVDVSELLRRPGASLRVHVTSQVEGLGVPLAWVEEGSGMLLDLALDALVDGIHVTGVVAARCSMRCSRCLTEFAEDLHRDVDEIAGYPGDERDDVYALDGGTLDLEPIIRDVVVGEMPFTPACRPDCKGLCPVCGADRNESDCGHDPAPQDARWAPLRSLQERLGLMHDRMEE